MSQSDERNGMGNGATLPVVSMPAESDRVVGALFGASSDSFESGRYVIMSTLGQGGMGVVFKAFDPALDRLVALKVLHKEIDEKHTIRLRREAQAMAKLSHPNVVQVYEVGEVKGQTFVAMEMVKGRTLREWMKQDPRPGWRACVRLFMQLGAGLAAAHEQGLVHRDFKPGNAIIDDKERPRVLDFGLARQSEALEEEEIVHQQARTDKHEAVPLDVSLTKTGAVLGTPAYMPPEQMRGEPAEARSDQFSFCVALYEAVYGERPYAGSTMMALMLSVRSGTVEPAPKGSAVPASLRTVLLRGLATEPDKRWPDMEALLEQLRGLVVPRRRRGLVLGGTVGLLAVGAGLGVPRYAEWKDRCTGAAAQLDGIWDEARRQEVKTAIVGTELSYAPDTWERVEPLLDEYTEAWTDKHTEVCEATRLRGEQSEEAMDLRMGCLRTRRTALDAAVKVLGEADDTVVREAVKLVADLPGLDRCDDLDALEQQQQRVPPPEDPQVAEEVEQLRERLAEIEAEETAGLYATALEHVEPVVAQAETLGYGPLLAEAKFLRGALQDSNGRYVEAEQELTDAYTLAIEHDHEAVELSSANALVSVVGNRLERHAEGRQWSRTALPLAQRLGEPKGVAGSWNNLGIVFDRQGEYEEAKAAFERALGIRQKALGAEHPAVATSWNNLGAVLDGQGEYEEAKAAHERALGVRQKALGEEHPDVAMSWSNLGILFDSHGEYEEAKAAHERALGIRQKALGEEHPDVAMSWSNLGVVFSGQGEFEEAKAAYERARVIFEKALGAEHPDVAMSWGNLGNVLWGQEEYEEAKAAFERALGIFEKALGAEHPHMAMSWGNLGLVLSDQGEYEEAKVAHTRALEIFEKTLGAEHPLVAYPLVGLATIALEQNDFDAARTHAERAVSIREAGEEAPTELALARFVLARALWSESTERARARALVEQARDVYAEIGTDGKTAKNLAETEEWLAKHHAP